MKYTPSIAVLTFLTLLLDPVSSLPLHDLSVRHVEGLTELDVRSPIEKRQDYGFGTPTHFGLGTPVERPNPCGTSGCTQHLKPRALSPEERRLARAIKKRSVQDGTFITNVQFSPD
jgi:hypothetical protein